MKKIIFSLLAFVIVGLGTTNASFPVKKSNNSDAVSETTTSKTNASEDMEALVISAQEEMGQAIESADNVEKTSKFSEEDWILLALWFFLGLFAAHRWYAGKPAGWNILFILTAGGCGIWAIVDLVNILRQDFM